MFSPANGKVLPAIDDALIRPTGFTGGLACIGCFSIGSNLIATSMFFIAACGEIPDRLAANSACCCNAAIWLGVIGFWTFAYCLGVGCAW